MYKIKLLAIAALAIIGALLIYNHFDNIKEEEPVVDRFSSEYDLVSQDNIFKYSNLDEIIDILENKSGIIFFCTPESKWCNYYANNLNTVLKNNNINEVYYFNIKDDRELNTIKYQKVLELLNNYIFKDDTNNSKLYMPDLTIVKDGLIIAHDNETSLIESDQSPESYWTQSRIDEFNNKIISYVNMLKN